MAAHLRFPHEAFRPLSEKERFQFFSFRCNIELPVDHSPGFCAHFAFFRQGQLLDFPQRIRQRPGITGRNEFPGAVDNQLRYTGKGSGNNGDSFGHGLHEGHGNAIHGPIVLLDTGQDEHIGAVHQTKDVRLIFGAEQFDGVVESLLGNRVFQPHPLLAFPDNPAFEIRCMPVFQHPAGVDQKNEPFLLHQPADGQDFKALPGLSFDFFKPGHIDAAMDSVDPGGIDGRAAFEDELSVELGDAGHELGMVEFLFEQVAKVFSENIVGMDGKAVRDAGNAGTQHGELTGFQAEMRMEMGHPQPPERIGIDGGPFKQGEGGPSLAPCQSEGTQVAEGTVQQAFQMHPKKKRLGPRGPKRGEKMHRFPQRLTLFVDDIAVHRSLRVPQWKQGDIEPQFLQFQDFTNDEGFRCHRKKVEHVADSHFRHRFHDRIRNGSIEVIPRPLIDRRAKSHPTCHSRARRESITI